MVAINSSTMASASSTTDASTPAPPASSTANLGNPTPPAFTTNPNTTTPATSATPQSPMIRAPGSLPIVLLGRVPGEPHVIIRASNPPPGLTPLDPLNVYGKHPNVLIERTEKIGAPPDFN